MGALRESLGYEGFDGACSEGAAVSLWTRHLCNGAHGERKRPSHGWSSLTPTELAVVRHVGQGVTNPQIAARMFVARGTVKIHLEHTFAKLGVKTRAELAAPATRSGAQARVRVAEFGTGYPGGPSRSFCLSIRRLVEKPTTPKLE